ncbi:FecR family protein [Lysobacter sp. CA199]|uniref:FecR family protein n=1 Tax=Lysobacter sp. CA199 TaxID=3455608 RepID=UPI003F8D3C75
MKCKISPLRQDSAEFAPQGVEETAAHWSERLREDDDPRTQAAFEAWLDQSPQHTAAFERVEAAQALVFSLAGTSEMQALRRETMQRLMQARRRSLMLRGGAIAASLLLATVLGVLLINPGSSWQTPGEATVAAAGTVYQTGVGQRSVVTLDDGSMVTLNTDSRISTHYQVGLRAITLERGQALFKVAKDRNRPFVVSAAGRQVTALGTEFDVYLSKRAFEVTLLEGRVTVTRESAPASSRIGAAPSLAELQPGQQFVALAKTLPQVRAADVKRVVSWRHGQIVFENERLEDAIVEMNRYSRQQIVLSDERLASLKISGAFNTGDTGTFVDALTAYFPIEHSAPHDGTIVLKPVAPIQG